MTTVVATPPPPSGLCAAPASPTGPLEFGQCVLAAAMSKAKSAAKIIVVVSTDPAAEGVAVEASAESYAIVSNADRTLVVGRDPVGAMYGALDVAERLGGAGSPALPLPSPVKGSPMLRIRAANLFILLPEAGKPYWFHDPSFWVEYLDMMARGRLNFLDLHGMYDPETTGFPNALLYFATSKSVPNAGLPRADREANLAALNRVIAMATVRGIKVGLMNYRADLSLVSKPKETEEEKAEATTYTREAVADLASRAPGLAYLGFRIGESQRKPEWYKETFLAGLKDAHGQAIPYTRTWGAKKRDLLSVVEASGPETIIEAKYNGEHLGQPYVISGGGMQGHGGHSFQEFLTPPAPYRFVFQVRAGGTNRIFRYASYSRTRRAVMSMQMSPRIDGFTLEAAHAYYPQRDFYHANPADAFSPWAFRRDELAYILFGRLGYDPNTPESVFQALLKDRVGTDGLWAAVQAASDITPLMLGGHTCGADQRDYAPELELGGAVGYWADPVHWDGPHPSCPHPGPFDTFALAGPRDAADDMLQGRATPQVSPVDLALAVLAAATRARSATGVTIDAANPEARDVVRECVALADLGEWFAHKFRGATALAVYEGSGSPPWLEAARAEVKESSAAYTALARDTDYIAPFDEHLRMQPQGMPRYHWRDQLPRLADDLASIEAAAATTGAQPAAHAKGPLPDPRTWLVKPRAEGPGLASLVISPNDARAASWTVTATLAAPAPRGSVVSVLHRPFRSDGLDWEAAPMTGSGMIWKGTVPGSNEGGMFAVEVNAGPGQAWRYPDVWKETPYRPLAP